MEMHTKKVLEEFKKNRKNSQEILSSTLFRDAMEIKRLDKQVDMFLEMIDIDIRVHDKEMIEKHAREFEKEINEEVKTLVQMTKSNILLFEKIVLSLNRFNEKLRQIATQKYRKRSKPKKR